MLQYRTSLVRAWMIIEINIIESAYIMRRGGGRECPILYWSVQWSTAEVNLYICNAAHRMYLCVVWLDMQPLYYSHLMYSIARVALWSHTCMDAVTMTVFVLTVRSQTAMMTTRLYWYLSMHIKSLLCKILWWCNVLAYCIVCSMNTWMMYCYIYIHTCTYVHIYYRYIYHILS